MSVLSTLRLSQHSRGRRVVTAGAATIGAATLALSTISGTSQAQPLAGQTSATQAASGSSQQAAQDVIGDDAQYECFSKIVEQESGWDHTARNTDSEGYGLVQAAPGERMAEAGSDWETSPATQVRWGVDHMTERHGSPCGAWDFWQDHSRY